MCHKWKFNMIKLLFRIIVLCIAVITTILAAPVGKHNYIKSRIYHTKTTQAAITPQQALSELKAGNKRFIKANMLQHDYLHIAKITSTYGQHPIAIVLSCIDSRSDPMILFDTGLGNIFSTAVAGNVISPNVLASMEYATKYAGAKLIVVMGHTQCGAIQAACTGKVFGHLHELISQIRPAVITVEKKLNNKNCADPTLIDAIARQNVINQIQAILKKSPILRNLVKSGQIKIVGAMHNIKTGQVTFFRT